jgi:hypothetical protein
MTDVQIATAALILIPMTEKHEQSHEAHMDKVEVVYHFGKLVRQVVDLLTIFLNLIKLNEESSEKGEMNMRT